MARLEIRLDGHDIGADKALFTARTTLRILRSIEKEMTGKRAAIHWKVDIFSGFRETTVVVRDESPRGKDEAVAFDTAELAMKRMAAKEV